MEVKTVLEAVEIQIEQFESANRVDMRYAVRARFYRAVASQIIEKDRYRCPENRFASYPADRGCGLWIMQLILASELLAMQMDESSFPYLASAICQSASVIAYG